MKGWLEELKQQCSNDPDNGGIIIHVVGTKSDLVASDPSSRKVPFEKTIAYVAEQLYPSRASTPPATTALLSSAGAMSTLSTSTSKRSSGLWAQDVGWDSCHEVNARDGEGIEEVFRVISRKLIEQRNRHWEKEQQARLAAQSPGYAGDGVGSGDEYFASGTWGSANKNGSFRLGYGDRRKSWLGLPSMTGGAGGFGDDGTGRGGIDTSPEVARRRGGCC